MVIVLLHPLDNSNGNVVYIQFPLTQVRPDPAPARAPDHTVFPLAIAPIASREIVRRIVELFVFFSICNCYLFCIFYLFLLLHLQALRLHLQASREIVRRIVVLFNFFNFQLSFVLQLFFIFATAIAVGSRGQAAVSRGVYP